MFRVGLTGNIASGKSSVARVWERLGAVVVDADALARRAVEPGSAGLRRVIERFGARVLQPDGSLDRAALRTIIFSDDEARDSLERILHPEIGRLREVEEDRLASQGERVVVHVVPLLFEAGLAEHCDLVVLVDAPEQVRLRRLIETRGVAESEATRMVGSQMPVERKRKGAHIIIENDGTQPALEARAAEVWREIEERAR